MSFGGMLTIWSLGKSENLRMASGAGEVCCVHVFLLLYNKCVGSR